MRTTHVFILAAAIIAAGVVAGLAQQGVFGPDSVGGCIVTTNATPGYIISQRVAFTCNTAGQLRVTTTP